MVPFACKKTDVGYPIDSKDTKNTLVRFFDKSETANPLIKEIADFILRKEEKKPFIKDFVNFGGYPLWNHSMITSIRNQNLSTLTRSGNEGETSVLIPFALENDSSINSILQVQMNSTDTTFNMLYSWRWKVKLLAIHLLKFWIPVCSKQIMII